MSNKKNIHNLRSIRFTSLFFLVSIVTFGQNNTYSALYEYKDSFDTNLESVLIVKGDESVFKILDEREAGVKYDENGEFLHIVTNDAISTIMYSNPTDCYVRIPWPELSGGATYKYDQNLMNWELTGNSKKIKNYNCQEALLNFHGREYLVWFTPEIPISKGPFNLDGLPGLIVEVQEKKGNFSLNLISLKKEINDEMIKKIKDFFIYTKVKEYPDYEKFMKKYVLELKIKKAQAIAEMQKQQGGTISFSFSMGQYHWVRKIIDIPDGLIKELGKIDFYEE
ncbi:GLPGLI family protein [Aquimarina rubra]|uniref:GLPGLI family protein n=1 Tax=Aquimarina rubra TaxID=1920033 RepID=A0ABW5LIY7_9FLAO